MMAPSSTEIKSIFESHILSQTSALKQGSDTSGSAQPGHLFHLFTDDVDFQIPGDGFSLACQVRGNQAVEMYLAKSKASFSSIIDPSKPMDVEVIQVMGGGESQWATAVLKTTATTKTEKPLNYESVIIMRFNDDGKIAAIKTYLDTLYLQNHLLGV